MATSCTTSPPAAPTAAAAAVSSSSSSSYANVRVTKSNGVGMIELARASKLNSWTQELYDDAIAALAQLANDHEVVVAMITGEGRFYSAGADLASAHKMRETDSPHQNRAFFLVQSLIDFPKPIIAAVNGPAIGIAVTTLALMDIVYASDTATFTTPFARLGLCAEGCSSVLFPQIMGASVANEMLLLGRTLTAHEAQRVGLVSSVISGPSSSFVSSCMTHAIAMAQYPPQALRDTKALMKNASYRAMLHEVNDREMRMLYQRGLSGDPARAAVRFAAQRAAKKKAADSSSSSSSIPSKL